MKTYNWNEEKNNLLKNERNICFEEIIIALENKQIINVYKHPNFEKYPNQKIYEILIDEYIYLVPFVENDTELFLKTIIPSRKATKSYINKGREDEN